MEGVVDGAASQDGGDDVGDVNALRRPGEVLGLDKASTPASGAAGSQVLEGAADAVVTISGGGEGVELGHRGLGELLLQLQHPAT